MKETDFHAFLTLELYEGELSASCPWALYPGGKLQPSTAQGAGCVQKPVWMRQRQKSVAPAGNRITIRWY